VGVMRTGVLVLLFLSALLWASSLTVGKVGLVPATLSYFAFVLAFISGAMVERYFAKGHRKRRES